jgi:hypothetical protein
LPPTNVEQASDVAGDLDLLSAGARQRHLHLSETRKIALKAAIRMYDDATLGVDNMRKAV